MYVIARFLARLVVSSFFRDVTILNEERIPRYGPVIFVGNHNNQFVDASMLLAKMPRHTRFLVADKSLQRPIIGQLSLAAGSIAVARPQDKKYRGLGFISWDTGDVNIYGIGTRFLLDLHPGDTIGISFSEERLIVKEVVSDNQIVVTSPLLKMMENPPTGTAVDTSERPVLALDETGCMLGCPSPKSRGGGIPFTVYPRIDQHYVYETVADALLNGDAIGIFPEGGSHDRLELLPLKPGVAVMALTAAVEGADDILIVPIGLNYSQAHKMLSRAIIQVGIPIGLPADLVDLFKSDRRAAASQLMKFIEFNLKESIISLPSYRVYKYVKLSVALFIPENFYLPHDKQHIVFQQFSLLFNKHKDLPEVLKFFEDIKEYASLLKGYGIADQEVFLLRQSPEKALYSIVELTLSFLVALVLGGIPCVLWGPLRISSAILAENHRKKALKESKVKIAGRDVVASFKILTLMILVPCTNFLYSLLFGMIYFKTWKGIFYSVLFGLTCLPAIYYYSIRWFEQLRVIPRRLRFMFLVLVCKLNAWRETEKEIITQRWEMQLRTRRLTKKLLVEGGDTSSFDLNICLPSVVVETDSRRLEKKLANVDFVPMTRRILESREEIL